VAAGLSGGVSGPPLVVSSSLSRLLGDTSTSMLVSRGVEKLICRLSRPKKLRGVVPGGLGAKNVETPGSATSEITPGRDIVSYGCWNGGSKPPVGT
jgi:hypothetical protein